MMKITRIISRILSRVLSNAFSQAPACSAVIAAAGSSGRMGGGDKLFAEICGAPVLAHTLMAFQNCSDIKEIVVVARSDRLEDVAAICGRYSISKATKIISGGATRLESVFNGVISASRKACLIAIHDGARPCIDDATIKAAVAKAAKHYAAAPGIPVAPTLKRVEKGVICGTVDRDGIYEIQTPQVFDASLIKSALAKAVRDSSEITDDCMAAELLGIRVHVTAGSPKNIKLTTAEDLPIAEAILGIGK